MRPFLASFALLALVSGCAASASTTSSGESAVTSAAMTPATIDPQAALAQMRAAVKANRSPLLVKATVADATLAKRFDAAKKGLERFGFAHTDLGDEFSEVAYVLSAPGATTFVGYAVVAQGSDDSDRWFANAAAYYTTAGELLSTESWSEGLSDSEESGDWQHADQAIVARETKALQAAISFDAKQQTVKITATKTTPVKADSLAFAKLVTMVQKELEDSTFAHSDLGCEATRLVSLQDESGATVGYILTSEGSDDADFWHAAGYALFSTQGVLVDRSIASEGRADNMDNDDVR